MIPNGSNRMGLFFWHPFWVQLDLRWVTGGLHCVATSGYFLAALSGCGEGWKACGLG
jgi:hypothetical protein